MTRLRSLFLLGYLITQDTESELPLEELMAPGMALVVLLGRAFDLSVYFICDLG